MSLPSRNFWMNYKIPPDLIPKILKFSNKTEPTSMGKIVNDVLQTIEYKKFAKADVKQIKQELREGLNTWEALVKHEYNFPYEPALITALLILNPTFEQTQYFTVLILNTFIAWMNQYNSKKTFPNPIEMLKLINRLLPILEDSRYITRAFQIICFCYIKVNTNEEAYSLLEEIICFIHNARVPSFIVKYIHQFWRYDSFFSDPRFHDMLSRIADALELQYDYFDPPYQVKMVELLSKFVTKLEPSVLKLIHKIGRPLVPEAAKLIIPHLGNSIIILLLNQKPIELPTSDETEITYEKDEDARLNYGYRYQGSFSNGFNANFELPFPPLMDLTSLIDENTVKTLDQVISIIHYDQNYIQTVIKSMLEMLKKTNDQYFTLIFLGITYICHEIIRVKEVNFALDTELALSFFNPLIFSPKITFFNSNEESYKLLNTFRTIALECCLLDNGDALDTILEDKLFGVPYLLGEVLVRCSNSFSFIKQIVETNPKIITTLIELMYFYQKLESSSETEDKEPITTVRRALISLIAHLLVDNSLVKILYANELFVECFVSFLFEDSLTDFVIDSINQFISIAELEDVGNLPNILMRAFSLLIHQPNEWDFKTMLLLITTFNRSFSNRSKVIPLFSDLCDVMLQVVSDLSTDSMSQEILSSIITFCALTTHYYTISQKHVMELAVAVKSFNDSEFFNGFTARFIQLLAGEYLPSINPSFIIKQPDILILMLEVFMNDVHLIGVLEFILKLCKYSPQNISECTKTSLDLYLLTCLESERAKETMPDESINSILDLYSLISLESSNRQSAFRFISLMAPLDDTHVSKYHELFYQSFNKLIIDSFARPPSVYKFNGSRFTINIGRCEMTKGFTIGFWMFIESPSDYTTLLMRFNLSDSLIYKIICSTSTFMIKQDDCVTESTGQFKIDDGFLEINKWIFISYVIEYVNDIVEITLSVDNYSFSKIIMKKPGHPIDFSNLYLKVGDKDITPKNMRLKLASIGIYQPLKPEEVQSIYEQGVRISKAPFPNACFINNYSYYQNQADSGFFDVFVRQCGIYTILPLFLQKNTKTIDEKPSPMLLNSLLMMLSNILTNSVEAQRTFMLQNGFHCISYFITSIWVDHFSIKSFHLLYSILQSLRGSRIVQQLFNTIITNFDLLMKLDVGLHIKILNDWNQNLFTEYMDLVSNICGFNDILSALRIFYWYNPVEVMILKQRPSNLNVRECRRHLFSILYKFLEREFTVHNFKLIISHCMGCSDIEQVTELLDFLMNIVTNYTKMITFNIEDSEFMMMVNYILRLPFPNLHIKIMDIVIHMNMVRLISDDYYYHHINALALNLIEIDTNKQVFFDFIAERLKQASMLLPIACALIMKSAPENIEAFVNSWEFSLRNDQPFNIAIWPLILAANSPDHIKDKILTYLINISKQDLFSLTVQVDIVCNYHPDKELDVHYLSLLISLLDSNFDDLFEILKYMFFFRFRKFTKIPLMQIVCPPVFGFVIKIEKPANLWFYRHIARQVIPIFNQVPKDSKNVFFGIVIASILQSSESDDINKFLQSLNITEEMKVDVQEAIQLEIYRTFRCKKEQFFEIGPNGYESPLVNEKLFESFCDKLKPKQYMDLTQSYFNQYNEFVYKIKLEIDRVNKFDFNKSILTSSLQLKGKLDKLVITREYSKHVWDRLWRSISYERSPWYNQYMSNAQLEKKRDTTICWAYNPVRMCKFQPDFDTFYNNALKKEFTMTVPCEVHSLDSREKGSFVVRTDMIIILSTFTLSAFPISAIKAIAKTTINGNLCLYFVTKLGQSIILSFEADDQAKVLATLDKDQSIRSPHMTVLLEKWMNCQISNYEFISVINFMAGRSFQLLDNYPVFPKILNHSEDTTINEFQIGLIRDFKEQRELPNKEAILYYLSNIEPYKSLNKLEQVPDNLELTPEFFCMPEVIKTVPKYAENALDFVYQHRKMLETRTISENINEWIGNVFSIQIPKKRMLFKEPIVKEILKTSCNTYSIASGHIIDTGNSCFKLLLLTPPDNMNEISFKIGSTTIKKITMPLVEDDKIMEIKNSSSSFKKIRTKAAKLAIQAKKSAPKKKYVQKQIVLVGDTNFALIDEERLALVDGDISLFIELQKGKFTCLAADDMWIVAADQNSGVTIFYDSHFLSSTQIYRDKIECIAVSSNFHSIAIGAKDSIFLMNLPTGDLNQIIKLHDMKLSHVLFTQAWGFIVCYCTQTVEDVVTNFLITYTINGQLIQKFELPWPIDNWYTWKSWNGFDYIVVASQSGRLMFGEVFTLKLNPIAVHCQAHVKAINYSDNSSLLTVVTTSGDIYFIPLSI